MLRPKIIDAATKAKSDQLQSLSGFKGAEVIDETAEPPKKGENPTMKKVPIMFVSSRNSPQDVTQALVLGACQYVLKSVPIGDIVAKIRKIVV